MNHKIAMLGKLIDIMHEHGANRIASMKAPHVEDHIERRQDEYPESRLLGDEMDSASQPHDEELSEPGDDVSARRKMFNKFGK